MVKVFLRSFLVAAVALCAACSVHESDAPALSGPSGGFGTLSLPTQTPTARFTFAPAAPAANSLVSFDGGSSCIGQADPNSVSPCSTTGSITVFTWSFGDGTGASGAVVSHSFDEAGTFPVRLTVTNSNGLSSSTAHSVTVGVGLLPTAAFTVSPTAPAVNGTVVFNAGTSVAGAGHTIAGFAWEFGDNSVFASGSIVTHVYTAPGTYVVALTAVDDAGQAATTTRTVTVGLPASPVAAFTFSPTSPTAGAVVFFDGSSSTTPSGAAINNYRWNFGDGTIISGAPAGAAPAGGTFQAPRHTFVAAGTYTVTLTVTDTNNLSGTTTGTVTVGP